MMRVVAALGGNALLHRGEAVDADVQLRNVTAAVRSLAGSARSHQLVVTHGNGPQVGLLANESASDPALARPYPLDVLGAETQGMIGYWLAQSLGDALPGIEVISVLTQTYVWADDEAFANPTKFVGPVLDAKTAQALAAARGWTVRPDGEYWRRVVPSPEPVGILEMPTIRRLVEAGVLVVAAGGGGVPVVRDENGHLHGVEAVVDKDLCAAVLADDLHADVLLLLTDVPAVMRDFGTPHAEPIVTASVDEMRGLARCFPDGSMGPKVEAACRFVGRRPGRRAAIGSLNDVARVLAGAAGTTITT